jgi:hypothetical protein
MYICNLVVFDYVLSVHEVWKENLMRLSIEVTQEQH